MAVHSKSVTSSGVVHTGRCYFHGFYAGGADGSNDITITIYDGVTAAGVEVVPTYDVDASALGLSGATQSVGEQMELGIYVEITTSGTATVTCKVEA